MPAMLTNKISGVSMLLAAFLFMLSTFYWSDGEYGIIGGMLLCLSMIFWIMVFIFWFEKLKSQLPLYSSLGLLIAIYGCISGVCFAFMGVVSEAFAISHDNFLAVAADHSMAFNLLLFWPGPLFPLSILVLGIQLWRKKIIPGWLAVSLILGGITFPISRIPRIELVAHFADVLLSIPLLYTGLGLIFEVD